MMDEYRVVLLAPDFIPEEFGSDFVDACEALGLPPRPGGYTLYLLDELNVRTTLVGAGASVALLRDTWPDLRPDDPGWIVADQAAVVGLLAGPDLVAARGGWPVELGGDPRCQFCRNPEAAWIYEGADVRVALEESPLGIGPLNVAGAEVVGVMDWATCRACHELIQTGGHRAYDQLLHRYGSELPPMPLQVAWRGFWVNHRRRALPYPGPEWSPVRRRMMAHAIRSRWSAWRERFPLDGVTFSSEPLPELAGMSAALDAARAYLQEPPPYGRIRLYLDSEQRPEVVRAEGQDWSLIGGLGCDPAAFVLLDAVPEALHPARGARTTALLHALADLARAQDEAVHRR
ncbi:hypothetical protein ACWCSD_03635 [Nonomuraea sp. NPDC001684]